MQKNNSQKSLKVKLVMIVNEFGSVLFSFLCLIITCVHLFMSATAGFTQLFDMSLLVSCKEMTGVQYLDKLQLINKIVITFDSVSVVGLSVVCFIVMMGSCQGKSQNAKVKKIHYILKTLLIIVCIIMMQCSFSYCIRTIVGLQEVYLCEQSEEIKHFEANVLVLTLLAAIILLGVLILFLINFKQRKILAKNEIEIPMALPVKERINGKLNDEVSEDFLNLNQIGLHVEKVVSDKNSEHELRSQYSSKLKLKEDSEVVLSEKIESVQIQTIELPQEFIELNQDLKKKGRIFNRDTSHYGGRSEKKEVEGNENWKGESKKEVEGNENWKGESKKEEGRIFKYLESRKKEPN